MPQTILSLACDWFSADDGPVSSSAATPFPLLPPSTETAAGSSLPVQQTLAEAEASDEVLLARVSGGDQHALGCLFQRYGRLLRSIAARILKDAEKRRTWSRICFFSSNASAESSTAQRAQRGRGSSRWPTTERSNAADT